MKIKQQVVLTTEEAANILSKVVASKTKKPVTAVKFPDELKGKEFVFSLEDGVVEDAPAK
jgi:phosphoribosylcarboxyaminoimidazole (NCAIR) mutase